jgi:hypothetical protein
MDKLIYYLKRQLDDDIADIAHNMNFLESRGYAKDANPTIYKILLKAEARRDFILATLEDFEIGIFNDPIIAMV